MRCGPIHLGRMDGRMRPSPHGLSLNMGYLSHMSFFARRL
jgi:hypothetical protein